MLQPASKIAEMAVTQADEYIKTGKIRYVTREFPLESIHPQAFKASEAALSAADPTNVIAMRTLAGAESALATALSQFMGLREAYPNPKADQNAARLMEELTSTENRVACARQAYNDQVMLYNTARQRFPNVLLAQPFGFTEAPLFQIENASERDVQKVVLG